MDAPLLEADEQQLRREEGRGQPVAPSAPSGGGWPKLRMGQRGRRGRGSGSRGPRWQRSGLGERSKHRGAPPERVRVWFDPDPPRARSEHTASSPRLCLACIWTAAFRWRTQVYAVRVGGDSDTTDAAMEKKLEAQLDAESMTTVNVKEYAPSEAFSTEPPPVSSSVARCCEPYRLLFHLLSMPSCSRHPVLLSFF